MINEIRKTVAQMGGNELAAAAKQEDLQELFKEKQRLVSEMNKAKKLAAEEAAKPFLEEIEAIDQQYALILSLTANSKPSSND